MSDNAKAARAFAAGSLDFWPVPDTLTAAARAYLVRHGIGRDQLGGSVVDRNRPFGDVHAGMMGNIQRERAELEEEHPLAYLAGGLPGYLPQTGVSKVFGFHGIPRSVIWGAVGASGHPAGPEISDAGEKALREALTTLGTEAGREYGFPLAEAAGAATLAKPLARAAMGPPARPLEAQVIRDLIKAGRPGFRAMPK